MWPLVILIYDSLCYSLIVRRLIILDIGKIKNIGLILTRQYTFAGSKIYFHGTMEIGVIAWVSLTAAAFEMMMFLCKAPIAS